MAEPTASGYPAALDTTATLGADFVNAKTFVLYTTMNASVTAVVTTGISGFSANNWILIDSEIMWVDSISSATFTVVRASVGAAAHTAGAMIYTPPVAQWANLVRDAIYNIEEELGVNPAGSFDTVLLALAQSAGEKAAAQGDVFYATAENAVSALTAGTSGKFLKTQGSSANPTWATVDLSQDTSPQLGGFLDANGNYIQMEKGADIVSGSPTVRTTGDFFDVTGTTTIAAWVVAADRHFFTQFDAVLQLTHDATDLDLPGGANITTAAGDVAEWVTTGANDAQCVNYTKVDGTPVVVNIVADTSPQLGGALDVNGNNISSASNANVTIAPHGTGDVVLDTDLVKFGGGSEAGTITSNGAYDLVMQTNSGTNSGTITIADGADGDITLAANGSGKIIISNDLQVDGTTTTVNSNTLIVDDPVIVLGTTEGAAPSSDDNKDRGILFHWYSGSAKTGFFGYDDSASKLTFIPDASISSEVISGSAGNVIFGNIEGLITTGTQGSITSANGITTASSLATVGTIGTGVWQGTAVATQYGGTGQNFSSSTGVVSLASGTASAVSMATKGDILAGDGTTDPQVLAVGSNNHILTAASGETTGIKWEALSASLTSEVSGTLPVANGGTNATSLDDKAVLITQDSGTDTVEALPMDANGELLIGGTSGPAVGTITAGSGVSVTNGNQAITVAVDCDDVGCATAGFSVAMAIAL